VEKRLREVKKDLGEKLWRATHVKVEPLTETHGVTTRKGGGIEDGKTRESR